MGRVDYLRGAADPSLDADRTPSKNGIPVRRGPLAVLAVAAGLALPAAAQAAGPTQATPLQRKLAQALRVPHVSPARSAAIALDLTSGSTVYTQNPSLSLAPASNEKLPITFAALTTLGPTYRFETDVLGEGQLDGTTWTGRLVLRGGGDPSLSSAGLRSLAAQVRTAGIRRVTAGVVGDESLFDARRTVSGWKAGFFLNESPPLSALVVDRDRVGGYLSRTPALSAAVAFVRTLRAAGVAVSGPIRPGVATQEAFPLGQVFSAPLWTILRFMDRESDNFTAELLLKQLGAVEAGRGTSAAGASVVTQALVTAGVPMNGVRIVDGSGLSTLDRLTAGAVTSMLHAAWTNFTIRPAFVAALAIAGVNGTLETRLRTPPARGNVLAKTGTTREASALSGFVRDRYVFAVLQNGNPIPSWWARRAQDRFATVLAGQ
jgi:D-alanyl-D-alanine carboxypeptidase/D-alanyl-D-alanine-endopeptidase (penicillin-binding protein 4)